VKKVARKATAYVDEEEGTVTSTSRYSTDIVEEPPIEQGKILLLLLSLFYIIILNSDK
jgi:hypothetical protein